MSSTHCETTIYLPPGVPSPNKVGELIRMVFDEFNWFQPRRYGYATHEKPFAGGTYERILAYYQEESSVCIAGRTDRDFFWIRPAGPNSSPYHGKLRWVTSAKMAAKAAWRSAHVEQVAEVMRLMDSPLALSALDVDFDRKNQRLLPDSFGQVLTFNIKNYSEGLAGLFWRNFYGPPFVRLLGEKLESLPPECRTRLGDELVLVQPYALPTEAGTESAVARERALIQLLGPECFYDHEHHRLPTRRPVLDDLRMLTSEEDSG